MTTSTDTPTNAAPQLPSATKPPLQIVGWLLTYRDGASEFLSGATRPSLYGPDCEEIAAVVLACDAAHAAAQQAQRIADLERHISNIVSESEAKIPAMQAAFEERLTLDRANRLLVARIADLETKCDTLKRLHDAAADERNTARGAVRELERQVFALQQQRDVLQTCLDRHQRDEVDPPGYLQDAVIRAAGLGALHTERDAAIKERDELRARLAGIEAQEPVALVETSGDQGAGIGWSRAAQPVGAKLYARPVPAIPEGWRLAPVEPTIAMCIAGDSPRMLVDDCTPTPAIYRAMIAAAGSPE